MHNEGEYRVVPTLSYGVIIAWIGLAASMALLFILAATGEIRLG